LSPDETGRFLTLAARLPMTLATSRTFKGLKDYGLLPPNVQERGKFGRQIACNKTWCS